MKRPHRGRTWAPWPPRLASAHLSAIPQLMKIAADDSPAEWRARAERLEEVDQPSALRCRQLADMLEEGGYRCLRDLPP